MDRKWARTICPGHGDDAPAVDGECAGCVPPPQRCELCRFWTGPTGYEDTSEHGPSELAGECRRYPPNTPQSVAWFPKVRPYDWCGEFEAVPVPVAMYDGLGNRV